MICGRKCGVLLITKEVKVGKRILKTSNLSKNSHVKILWKCDKCDTIIESEYREYLKHKKDEKNNIYCVHCAPSIFCSKENHYNWKNELSDDDRIYRKNRRLNPQYIQFVKTIMKRDNATCQICKQQKNGHMVVHHLESYSSNKDLSIDISNGICLCEDCHKNFHKLYGNKNNTRKQFEEWSNIITNIITDIKIPYENINAIYCIEDNEIIYNITEYCNTHKNVYRSSLKKCCDGKQAKVNQKHYMYYFDYINKNQNEIQEYIKDIDNKFKRHHYIKRKVGD